MEPIDVSRMSTMDLVLMQHDLRKLPEDRQHLEATLKELAKRAKKAEK